MAISTSVAWTRKQRGNVSDTTRVMRVKNGRSREKSRPASHSGLADLLTASILRMGLNWKDARKAFYFKI